MKLVAFDIETQPNTHRLDRMPAPEVKLGNLKDPVKIDEKRREAAADQLERAALDPNFGRIVCVSFAWQESGEIKSQTLLRMANGEGTEHAVDFYERALLTDAWEFLAKFDRFVTFNGAAFDIPFMLRRSLLLGVTPLRIDCHPYRVTDPASQHIDLMRVLHDGECGGGAYKKNLHFYAQLILGDRPTYAEDFDKTTIGRLFDRGHYDQIIQVCRWDAEATLRLFGKVVLYAMAS